MVDVCQKEVGIVFKKGDVFIYGTSGVCRIEDICIKDLGMMKKEYYILRPVYDERSILYIPTDSEKLAVRAKTLLTEKEVYEIADNVSEKYEWVIDDKQRNEVFKNILEEGKSLDMAKLIYTLHCRKKELAQKSKKLRGADENILQRAEKLLYEEFAYVLGVKPEEVPDIIKNRANT